MVPYPLGGTPSIILYPIGGTPSMQRESAAKLYKIFYIRNIFLTKIEHMFEKMHFFLFFERSFENIAIPLPSRSAIRSENLDRADALKNLDRPKGLKIGAKRL
mgnify:CR=1 FL=1